MSKVRQLPQPEDSGAHRDDPATVADERGRFVPIGLPRPGGSFDLDDFDPEWTLRSLPVPSIDGLSRGSRDILHDYISRAELRFGFATFHTLRCEATDALLWAQKHFDPDKGAFETFARAVILGPERRLVLRIGRKQLRRELRDQELREKAVDPNGVTKYLHHTDQRLKQLMRMNPRNWRLPGADPDELRRDALSAVFERMVGDPQLRTFERLKPGQEVGVRIAQVFRWKLHTEQERKKRVRLTTSDGELLTAFFGRPEGEPGADELLANCETNRAVAESILKVAARLKPKQAEVLYQVRSQLESNPKLILAEVARTLDRDRTTVSRAWAIIRARMKAALRGYEPE